jgi:hypothetical protein
MIIWRWCNDVMTTTRVCSVTWYIWCDISAHKKTTHEEHRHGHDLEHKHALDFAQQLLLPNDEINAISRLPKHAAGWAGHVSPTGLHNKVWPGQVMPSPFGKLSMTRTVIQTRPQRSQNGRCLCSCVHVYVYLSVCLSVHLKCVSLDLASKALHAGNSSYLPIVWVFSYRRGLNLQT